VSVRSCITAKRLWYKKRGGEGAPDLPSRKPDQGFPSCTYWYIRGVGLVCHQGKPGQSHHIQFEKEKQHKHKKQTQRLVVQLTIQLTIHSSRKMMCLFPSSTRFLLSSFWEIVQVFLMWVGAPCPSAGVMSMWWT